jgi:hypothetical protein
LQSGAGALCVPGELRRNDDLHPGVRGLLFGAAL